MDNIRVPPWSCDAEQSVIGSLLLDNSAFDKVQGLVLVDDFYRADHRLLFGCIRDLSLDNKPYDVVTIADFLRNEGFDDGEFGGLAYLGTLAKDTPSAANVQAYANIVRDKSLLRQAIKSAGELTEAAFSNDGSSAKDLIGAFESAVFALAEKTINPSEAIQHVKPLMRDTLSSMEELSKRGGDEQLLGVTTGSNDLNAKLAGLPKGDLLIVAGRPSMGKTTLAMNFAESASVDVPVVVFSMEMPAQQLMQRLFASQGRIELDHVRRTWKMDDVDWGKLAGATKALKDRHLYIDDSAALTVGDIRARCRRLRRKLEKKHPEGLGLIVIDYLQLMSSMGSHGNRNGEIEEISRGLKQLAKEMDVPVVLLSQLNRSVEGRPNKRPMLSDLRESGAIEQDADVVMFVYRDEIYNPDTEHKGVAEIIIRKYRNGEVGTVPMAFLGKYSRFEDLSTDYYSDSYQGGM